MKKLFVIFCSVLFLASCTKTPEACFTVDKGNTNTKVNEEIHFAATCSKDATTYSWNFGDNSTADGSDVKHKYPNAGTYTVTLTASNSSKSSKSSQIFTITP